MGVVVLRSFFFSGWCWSVVLWQFVFAVVLVGGFPALSHPCCFVGARGVPIVPEDGVEDVFVFYAYGLVVLGDVFLLPFSWVFSFDRVEPPAVPKGADFVDDVPALIVFEILLAVDGAEGGI